MEDSPSKPKSDAPPDAAGPSMLEEFIASKAFPFVGPFLVFMAFLLFQDDENLYVIYPLKALLTALVIIWIWPRLPKLRVKTWLGSVAVGVVGFFVWVGLEPYVVWSHDAHSGGYLPFQYAEENGYSLNIVYALIAAKVLSMVIVVPIAEELFWRGFLMRFLINPKANRVPRPAPKDAPLDWLDYDLDRFTCDDWAKNPLGQYRHVSFWGTTLAFSLVHGDFMMLAIVYGILIGWLFCRTKSLADAILAHAVTNLLLAIYVMNTGNWWFW